MDKELIEMLERYNALLRDLRDALHTMNESTKELINTVEQVRDNLK